MNCVSLIRSRLLTDLFLARFTEKDRVSKTITLGPKDTIKVALTTKEGSKAKRAHQVFLMLKESSGLEAPFPLTVKDSGKGAVEIVRTTRLPPATSEEDRTLS
jgi:hypothetical protein